MPTQYKPIYLKHYFNATFNQTHLPFVVQKKVLNSILRKVGLATSAFITQQETRSPKSFAWLPNAQTPKPTDISAWWGLLKQLLDTTDIDRAQPSKLANSFVALKSAQDALENDSPDIPIQSLMMIADDAEMVCLIMDRTSDFTISLQSLRGQLGIIWEKVKFKEENSVLIDKPELDGTELSVISLLEWVDGPEWDGVVTENGPSWRNTEAGDAMEA